MIIKLFILIYWINDRKFNSNIGALLVQRKTEDRHEINEQKRYARIIYNDLSFAFNDLLQIYTRSGA